MDKNELFQNLFKAWKAAYPHRKAGENQLECTKYWNSNKNNITSVVNKIEELKLLVKQKEKKQPTLFEAFRKQPVPPSQTSASSDVVPLMPPPPPSEGNEESKQQCTENNQENIPKGRPTRAQDELEKELSVINADIAAATISTQRGTGSQQQRDFLKGKIKDKERVEQRLSKLKRNAESGQRSRENKKRKLEKAKEASSEVRHLLENVNVKEKAGRPRVEVQHPMLLRTIAQMFETVAAADPRRRSEVLRSCTTLNDLHEKLKEKGFTLGRTTLYRRLIPRNHFTAEGKRHVNTVPVRLARAQNSEKAKHKDAHFANAGVKYMKDFVNLYEPDLVCTLSQDDKAKVLMGLPAANKQAPILMHMQYRVTLPDHDFVVAPKHKLIPSVYAGLVFKSGKLSYTGPTHVAIRSGVHDKSTAASHFQDLKYVFQLPHFQSISKIPNTDIVKPIVVIFTDGGPDENPRFPKTLVRAKKLFEEHDLDALFMVTHAPGQSAYNQVERRMAPLSHDLAGIILPHDTFGSHLDKNGKITDDELAVRNVEKAGEVLAEIWRTTVVDGFETSAQYCGPDEAPCDLTKSVDEKWKFIHVRQSRYQMQIVKCNDISCCKPKRTNIFEYIGSKFLPAPIPHSKTSSGVVIESFEKYIDGHSETHFGDLTSRLLLNNIHTLRKDLKDITFDHYCPSIHDKLSDLTCDKCKCCFTSKTARANHQSVHNKRSKFYVPMDPQGQENSMNETVVEVEDLHTEGEEIENAEEDENATDQGVVIISDLSEWLSSPWIQEL